MTRGITPEQEILQSGGMVAPPTSILEKSRRVDKAQTLSHSFLLARVDMTLRKTILFSVHPKI